MFAAASPKEDMSKSAVFACENREAIRENFADFQTKACVKLEEIGVNIGEFRLFVTSQFSPGHFIPSLPTSLKEVFEEITHHEMWDYYHYSPLVRIIRKFGDGNPEMEALIQKYRKDLKSYTLVTTIEDCIEAEFNADTDPPPAMRTKYDPLYLSRVEWKTDFIDHSLKYLTDVWEMFSSHYLVPESPPTALLDRVRTGCVSTTWLVPSSLIPHLIKTAKIDTAFFQKHRILKVMVDDQCVYEEEISKDITSVSINEVINTSVKLHTSMGY